MSQETVQIPRELLEEALEYTLRLMDHFSPNPQGSDYRCEFCGSSPTPKWEGGKWHQVDTVHKDCFGEKFCSEAQKILLGEKSGE